MGKEILNDLKILGASTTSGGYFRNIAVTGECKIAGDVNCEKLRLTGELDMVGNLYADELRITGECAVGGRAEGTLLKGRGELKTSSSLKIERIKFTGNLAVNGDCESDHLQIFGAVQVAGLLNADQLEMGLYGPSHAKEVGGGSIVIKRSTAARIIGFVKPWADAFFEAELVEGDLINLQYTKAGTVRGKQIQIGADCEIQRVEYYDTLEIHKSAKVHHHIRLINN